MRSKKIIPIAYPSIYYLECNDVFFLELGQKKKNCGRSARLEADQTAEQVPGIVFVISQSQRLSTLQDTGYLLEWDFVVSHWV